MCVHRWHKWDFILHFVAAYTSRFISQHRLHVLIPVQLLSPMSASICQIGPDIDATELTVILLEWITELQSFLLLSPVRPIIFLNHGRDKLCWCKVLIKACYSCTLYYKWYNRSLFSPSGCCMERELSK